MHWRSRGLFCLPCFAVLWQYCLAFPESPWWPRKTLLRRGTRWKLWWTDWETSQVSMLIPSEWINLLMATQNWPWEKNFGIFGDFLTQPLLYCWSRLENAEPSCLRWSEPSPSCLQADRNRLKPELPASLVFNAAVFECRRWWSQCSNCWDDVFVIDFKTREVLWFPPVRVHFSAEIVVIKSRASWTLQVIARFENKLIFQNSDGYSLEDFWKVFWYHCSSILEVIKVNGKRVHSSEVTEELLDEIFGPPSHMVLKTLCARFLRYSH